MPSSSLDIASLVSNYFFLKYSDFVYSEYLVERINRSTFFFSSAFFIKTVLTVLFALAISSSCCLLLIGKCSSDNILSRERTDRSSLNFGVDFLCYFGSCWDCDPFFKADLAMYPNLVVLCSTSGDGEWMTAIKLLDLWWVRRGLNLLGKCKSAMSLLSFYLYWLAKRKELSICLFYKFIILVTISKWARSLGQQAWLNELRVRWIQLNYNCYW